MQHQLLTTPSPNCTIERIGRLVGAHVVDRQITEESTRIPMRLLFELEDKKTMFEHVVSVNRIIRSEDVLTLEWMLEHQIAPERMIAVEFNTRPHSHEVWTSCRLELGGYATLSIQNLHQRFNKNTNYTFVDRYDRPIWHATYCYFDRIANPNKHQRPVQSIRARTRAAVPLPF